MNDPQVTAQTASRSFIVDGPPFVAVAAVFVLLVTFWLGRGQPVLGVATLSIGMIATVALDFRQWLASLPARLAQARALQIERDRWR